MGCSSAQNPSIVPISLGVQIVLKAHFTSLVKFMGRYFIFIIIVSLNLSELTLYYSPFCPLHSSHAGPHTGPLAVLEHISHF